MVAKTCQFLKLLRQNKSHFGFDGDDIQISLWYGKYSWLTCITLYKFQNPEGSVGRNQEKWSNYQSNSCASSSQPSDCGGLLTLLVHRNDSCTTLSRRQLCQSGASQNQKWFCSRRYHRDWRWGQLIIEAYNLHICAHYGAACFFSSSQKKYHIEELETQRRNLQEIS